MDEVLTMAQREIDKLHVIRKVVAGELSWSEGAQQLRLSARQVGRLCARVRLQGAKGVIHGLRGRPSNRGFDVERMERVIGILHDPLWVGFGPTFARDKLAELHGIRLSDETLRRWMMKAGLWRAWHGPKKHRAWRERRPRIGMMVQLDGSEHAWFEARGPRCTLVLYIDDATSRILYGEFAESEDTLTLLRTTRAYLERYGRPVCYYVDKDSIYKVNFAAKWERDAKLPEPLTQFTRAMTELGIEVQCAHSPQAKGRVERSFKTHQDRLVKELRLAGISSIGEANRLLWDRYIPAHNERYSVAPGEAVDAHRPLLAGHRLEEVLSLRMERTVQNDFTVQYGGRFLQILAGRGAQPHPSGKVLVESRLDGSLHLRYADRYLTYEVRGSRPYRPKYRESFPTKNEVNRIDADSERAKISVAKLHYLRHTKGRPNKGRFTTEALDLKYGYDAYESVGLGTT